MLKQLLVAAALTSTLITPATKASAATPNPVVEDLAYTAYQYAYDAYIDAYDAYVYGGDYRTFYNAYYAFEYSYTAYVNYSQAGDDDGYFAYAAEYSFLAIFDDFSDLGSENRRAYDYTFQSFINSFYVWYYLDAAYALSLE